MNALALSDAELAAAASAIKDTALAGRAVAPTVLTGRTPRIAPLRRSPCLLQTSVDTVALTRDLYGRESLRRTIDGRQWRFRWRQVAGPLTGVLLQLRIDDAQLTVGLECTGPSDALADVMRPEIPPELRSVYLSGVSAALWREIEAIIHSVVELVGVQPDSAIGVPVDCAGFELALDSGGPPTRGFVSFGDGPADAKGRRILREATRREMMRARLPMQLPVCWAAVVGSTALAAADVRTLQVEDTVVIDDAAFTAEALSCWLGAGATRRCAGRAELRQGQLRFIELATKGDAVMQATASTQIMNDDTADASSREARFEEIQVNLRFELAQWQAPLADVATLAGGTVIDLGHRIDGQSVSVWAEQRCIGRGQLVALGDRLGVRLLTIFGTAAAPAPQGRQQPAQSPPQSAAVQPEGAASAESPADAAAPEPGA